jgi:hypothetical protein
MPVGKTVRQDDAIRIQAAAYIWEQLKFSSPVVAVDIARFAGLEQPHRPVSAESQSDLRDVLDRPD